MNRYLVVDFETYDIMFLNKVDLDFEENDAQTSSTRCIDRDDLLKELTILINEIKDNN